MSVNLNFVPFRIDPAADEASAGNAFLAAFNAFLAANGYPTLPAVGDPIVLDKVRMDFDGPFLLGNGFWHINAMATQEAHATMAQAQPILDALTAQIGDWFGAGGGNPVCPGLATYTSPIAPGQKWPSDHANGVVLLDPPPVTRQRR